MKLPQLYKWEIATLLLANLLLFIILCPVVGFTMLCGLYSGFQHESYIEKAEAINTINYYAGIEIDSCELIKGKRYEMNIQGDGTLTIYMRLLNNSVIEQIKSDTRWKSMSQDKSIYDCSSQEFTQKTQEIKHGYWFYCDDEGGGINDFKEYVQWEVIALYDTQKDILYFEVKYY